MKKFIRNETTTGCGACPHLTPIGECDWWQKCSHTLTYTYNTDGELFISPIPWVDPSWVYLNNEEEQLNL